MSYPAIPEKFRGVAIATVSHITDKPAPGPMLSEVNAALADSQKALIAANRALAKAQGRFETIQSLLSNVGQDALPHFLRDFIYDAKIEADAGANELEEAE